ncbi:MAG: STT3 domain-containing protein [Desulfurococcaceae archaeon]|nr:hypothetical protein [Sulfolobales archaeon]MDW8170014.1 STT3 domain-containing protein [Desulfurococcaceae archaeon]
MSLSVISGAIKFMSVPRVKNIIKISILIALMALGIYLRLAPTLGVIERYGLSYALELHENDPWIEYWTTKFIYEHGVLSWWRLTPSDPEFGQVVKVFYYPWGRDFTSSSFFGLNAVAALTYPIAGVLGLSLKEWMSLQPLIYAIVTMIVLYFLVKELTDGNDLAALASVFAYVTLPSTVDRTMVTFVEKTGAGIAFILLSLLFYSRLVKAFKSDFKKAMFYAILTGASMGVIGWYWGGFQYVFAAFPLAIAVYPIFSRDKPTLKFLLLNIAVSITSLVISAPALSNLVSLGFYPEFKLTGTGTMAIASYILPMIYVYGLSKRILNKRRYMLLLLVIGLVTAYLVFTGRTTIGGRTLLALTPPPLRGLINVGPLVESVGEHQPGVGEIFSEAWGYLGIVVTIIGSIYILVKGRADHIVIFILTVIAIYAYINVAYFSTLAATFAVINIGIIIGALISASIPQRLRVKKKRSSVTLVKRISWSKIALTSTLIAIIAIPLTYATTHHFSAHRMAYPSMFVAGTGIPSRNDAWYEALDFIVQNTSSKALIVTWWDYGYWVTVNTGRATLADGSTLNGTQIELLAKALTSFNGSEVVSILRNYLDAPLDETYVIVYDVFQFVKQGNVTYVFPLHGQVGLGMAGRVDIPKSIWMIRIGNRDPDQYLYLYRLSTQGGVNYVISPRFDKPDSLPLIYKMMVNGILYLNIQENKTNTSYQFLWYTGSEAGLDYGISRYVEPLGISKQVNVASFKFIGFEEYNNTLPECVKPYRIVFSPFYDYPELYTVVFIYKVDFSCSIS